MSANEPAYPYVNPRTASFYGLTKREHFILEMAKANRIGNIEAPSDEIAKWAAADADALLAKIAEVKS